MEKSLWGPLCLFKNLREKRSGLIRDCKKKKKKKGINSWNKEAFVVALFLFLQYHSNIDANKLIFQLHNIKHENNHLWQCPYLNSPIIVFKCFKIFKMFIGTQSLSKNMDTNHTQRETPQEFSWAQ